MDFSADMLEEMDPQEAMERFLATQAYAGEDPHHFVNFVEECVKESKQATEDIRRGWSANWEAYQAKIDYSEKEDWQAQATTNDPWQAVKQAKSNIAKAFKNPDYFSIEGVEIGDRDYKEVVKKGMGFWLNPQHANFPVYFTDACEMGLIVGQCSDIVPMWDEEKGLVIYLIEPWKIYRDPDSEARKPWSGMYWIHEEWMDLWQMKASGLYTHLDEVKEEHPDDNREQAERRKNYFWHRSKFRKSVRVREFWGTVLDSKDELLMPNCTFTVAGDQVVRMPRQNPYVRLRWPGVSFSPFTELLRYEGKGIVEGMITIWWLLCNIMNLTCDNLNWIINSIKEIDIDVMRDPGDTEVYPGKHIVRKAGSNPDSPAISERAFGTHLNEVMAFLQYLSQQRDNSSFVNQFVAGLPGTRSNITKGEVEIKTRQSLGIFELMGDNFELGGIDALWAIFEVVMLNWTKAHDPSIQRVFGKEYKREAMAFGEMSIDQRRAILKSNADISISGISAQLQQAENVEKMMGIVDKLLQSPMFAQFTKPYDFLKELAEIVGFHDPSWIMADDEVQKMSMLQGTQFWQTLAPEQQQMLGNIIKNAGLLSAT